MCVKEHSGAGPMPVDLSVELLLLLLPVLVLVQHTGCDGCSAGPQCWCLGAGLSAYVGRPCTSVCSVGPSSVLCGTRGQGEKWVGWLGVAPAQAWVWLLPRREVLGESEMDAVVNLGSAVVCIRPVAFVERSSHRPSACCCKYRDWLSRLCFWSFFGGFKHP